MSYHHNEHSHIEKMHHDHVEHCCGCIPVNIGAHLLGIGAIIGTLTSGYKATKYLSLTGLNLFSLYFLVLAVVTAYAAVRYLLMLHHKTPHSKEQFANAYKCYTVWLRVINVVGAILLELILVYFLVILGSVDLSTSSIGWLVQGKAFIVVFLILVPIITVISVMLLGHFKNVIHTFAEKHDDYIKC